MATGAQLVTLIPIKKMDRALTFYTNVLGGKLQFRGDGAMKNFWASMKVGGAEVWLVAPGKLEKRKLAYQTFVVKDIKKYVADLKRKGVKFQKAEAMNKDTKVVGPIAFEKFGAAAFFKDPEGNLLMAWQNFPPM
ncbi:MAG: VOC family protein [Thermoplasmata archaeon]|nr:VOC family protein [Thermoplasmata archaeon]